MSPADLSTSMPGRLGTIASPPAAADAVRREDLPVTGAPPVAAYVAAFLVGLVFFALNVNYSMSGDSGLYADYGLNGKFDEITVHYGYYWVIWAADRTVGALLHIPMHEMVADLNVLFGALSLPVCFALGWKLLKDWRYAALATAFFVLCGRVVLNATSGEIYMLQTLVVYTAFLLWVDDRRDLAAVVAGLSFYVSPLSVFAVLFFPAYDILQHRRLRVPALLRLAIIAFLVYLPFLVVHGHEMLFGIRGLLVIPNVWPVAPKQLLANFPRYQFKHYTLLLALLAPLLFALRRERNLLILTAAVFLPHFYVISKLTSEDNVFILNTDFLFCCCLAAGARVLMSNKALKYVPALLLVGHVALLTRAGTYFSFQHHTGDAEELGSLARTYLEGKNAVFISDWDRTITVPYFGRPGLRGTVMHDPLYRQMVDATLRATSVPRPTADTVYVLETWSPGGLARMFRSDAQLAGVREENSWRAWAKRNFGFDCPDLVHRGTYELYRCRTGGSSTGP